MTPSFQHNNIYGRKRRQTAAKWEGLGNGEGRGWSGVSIPCNAKFFPFLIFLSLLLTTAEFRQRRLHYTTPPTTILPKPLQSIITNYITLNAHDYRRTHHSGPTHAEDAQYPSRLITSPTPV